MRLYTHTHTHTESLTKKDRVKYIDIARGIAIILMVIGHVLTKGWKRNVIFSFHMPFFILISGFLYREKTIKENLKNIFFKLILPYLICTLLIDLYRCSDFKLILPTIGNWFKQILFSYTFWGKIKFDSSALPLGVLWFFPLLALVKIIFIILNKKSNGNPYKLFYLCFIITFIGYALGKVHIWLPFSLDVAFYSISFYYIGYIFNKKDILKKILEDNKIMIIIFIIWVSGIGNDWIEIAVRRYVSGIFSFVTAVCGTIVLLKISLIIEKKLKYLGNILAWYGKNSMYILMLHYIEIETIEYDKIFSSVNTLYKIEVSLLKLTIITICTMLIDILKKIFFKIKLLIKN